MRSWNEVWSAMELEQAARLWTTKVVAIARVFVDEESIMFGQCPMQAVRSLFLPDETKVEARSVF